MSYPGRNAQPGTGTVWDGTKWGPSFTGVLNFYIDDVAGSDSSPGTALLPWKTIQKFIAVCRADGGRVRVPTILNIMPHSSAAGYDMTGVQTINGGQADLTFKGVGTVELRAPVTVTAVPSDYQFTFPAASFTSQAHRGFHLDCVAAANPVSIGAKRTVIRNTATDVWLGYRYNSGAIVPGDSFRVTEPAVILALSNLTPIVGGPPDEPYSQGGAPAVNFVNVVIKHPNSTYAGSQTFTGGVRFFGVIFKNFAQEPVRFEKATVWAGRRFSAGTSWSFLDQLASNGWGLSVIRDAADVASPSVGDIEMISSTFYGVVVANRLTARAASTCTVTGGAFANTTAGSGALRTFASNSQIGELLNTAWIFLDGIVPTSSVLTCSEGGNLSINSNRVQQISGTTGMGVADSRVVFNGASCQPILLGPVLVNGNGALVSLEGVDGSTVTGGFSVPAQTQATFAVGDCINSLGAQVYRPS